MPLKPNSTRWFFIFCFLFFSLIVNAQDRTITGTITDPNNQPLSGATITVKGTNIATQTDASGRFSLSVPADRETLTISSVGYEPRDVAVSGQTTISATLQTATSSLNEVVVTGYTAQRKRDITGAVTVVNVSELKSQPAADPSSQLQGRASGVTVVQSGVPGQPAQVRIRGLGSFQNNNPLYVVDGVQTSSIVGLNPNDIESMQVLKDAASASVYGARASNGVIVITTRKGRRRGVNVAYDMYYGVQDPGKGLDMLNAQEQAELAFLARRNSGLPTTGSVYGNGQTPVLPDYIFATGAQAGTLLMEGHEAVNPSRYSLDYSRLGDPAGYTPYIIVPANKAGTNWYDVVTRNAPIQNHNLSLSGANEASRFLLSLNYFDQQAITQYQFYRRYNARLNSEFNVFKSFRVGENLQVFSSEANVPGQTGDMSNNSEASVIAQTFRPMSIVPVYTIRPGDFAGTAGGSGFGSWGNAVNPLANLYRRRNDRSNDVNIFGNVYAELDFLQHFTARSSFGGFINTSNNYTYPYIEYENSENLGRTTYNENFIRNNNWIWTNQLTYKNIFGDHNITALVGQEAQRGFGRQIIGGGTGFFTYNYEPFINLNNANVHNLAGSNIFTPVSTLSYFANVNYAFKNKYLFTGTFRRDGSSKFLGRNRWGNFPAFSLGWRISDEPFMGSLAWVTDLKLRGSWGKMGNEAAVNATNAFSTFGSNRQSSWYDINVTQNSPAEGFGLASIGFNARWETSVSTNIGFDATLFNGTTDVVFDWYKRDTRDLLFQVGGQGIMGGLIANRPPFRNVASMSNNGIDLMISNRARVTSDIRLNTTFTFTTYNNEITGISEEQGITFFDYNSPANEANRIGQAATRNMVGQPVGTFFGYQVAGLFQTAAEATAWNQRDAAPGRFKYADINGDKQIDENDRTIIGDPNPDFTYGLNLGTEFKGFDVSAFFYGVWGKEIFNFTRWFTDFMPGAFAGGRSRRALYESWLPDGSRPGATTPVQEFSAGTGFSSFNAVNSYYIENGSYFRLRNLQVGYTLPSALTDRVKLSRVRVYLQGANLFTITKYTGFNPDIVSSDERASSIDVGAYPTVRQYLFGASINF